MGLFDFIAGAKEKKRQKHIDKEQKLLEQPNTAKAIVVEVVERHIQDWIENPYDLDGERVWVDDYWENPVVRYNVDGEDILSQIFLPYDWFERGKKCSYKVDSYVIVRYKKNDHCDCDILCKCIE